MFVVPMTRPYHRAAAPQFTRFIDRLLDDSLGAESTRTPALDVAETDTGYTVSLDVPGVTREQLKVSVDGRRVTVETAAEAPAEPAKDGAPRLLYRERSSARYARTVSLPAEVDQASSQARFENGVLTLTLVKKVPTGALQISIS